MLFHNTTDTRHSKRIDVPNVNISIPYDPSELSIVQPYQGNSTNMSVADMDVWTGRYATLVVEGNQGQSSSGPGATVAEWAVVI